MRRWLSAVIVVCLLASVAAATGFHGTTIRGAIQTESGDSVGEAAVLVQPAGANVFQNATSGDRAVRASLVEVANQPPLGISRNRSAQSGNYTVHLSRRGKWEVVVGSSEGVSLPGNRRKGPSGLPHRSPAPWCGSGAGRV